MCPMRFILVFFSAILAGYLAWKSVRSIPEANAIFSEDLNEGKVASNDNKQEFNIIKMVQNGFWVFVDMASGRYLWRNFRGVNKEDEVKSS